MKLAEKVLYGVTVIRRVIFVPISLVAVGFAIVALVCAYGFESAGNRVYIKRASRSE